MSAGDIALVVIAALFSAMSAAFWAYGHPLLGIVFAALAMAYAWRCCGPRGRP